MVIIMKKQYFLFAIPSLFLSLASCSSGDDIRIKDFPVTNKISGVAVEMSKPYMFVDMALADSLLILSPVLEDTDQIHIFNKQTFHLLKTAGVVGRGPGEVTNPGLSYVCDNTMMVWLTDYGRRALLGFSLKDIVESSFTGFNTIVPLPESVFIITRFQAHPDNLFSFTDAGRPEYLISFFDTAQSLLDSLSVPDKLDLYSSGDVSVDRRMMQFNYVYSFNRDGERIAVAYRFSDEIGRAHV